MKSSCIYTVSLLILSFMGVFAQNGHQHLRKGDKAYDAHDFEKAEQHYKEAEKEKSDFRSTYNLGNAYMQQNKFEDAVQKYNQAAEKANHPDARADIYHNLGNALFSQGNYKESIDAYKTALSIKPSDQTTLENMMLAKKMFRKQKEQQQQQSSKNKNERDTNPSENQKQDAQSNTKDQNQPQDREDIKKSGNQENQGLQQQGSGLSAKDADQLLDIMTNEETRVQRKLTKNKDKTRSGRKDW